MTRISGVVDWFDAGRGYGFIHPAVGDRDIFVHISEVERAGMVTLTKGQKVEFETGQNRGKPQAVNLKAAR